MSTIPYCCKWLDKVSYGIYKLRSILIYERYEMKYALPILLPGSLKLIAKFIRAMGEKWNICRKTGQTPNDFL